MDDRQANDMLSTGSQLMNSDMWDRMQAQDPRSMPPSGPESVRAVFLLYHSPNDAAYKKDFPGSVPSTADGVTGYQPDTAIPNVTQEFELTGGGATVDSHNTTMHELGHWADNICYEATNSKDDAASDSPWVKTNLTDDQNIFNSLTQCGSTSAVFYNQLDSANVYICNGVDGKGSGLNTAKYSTKGEKSFLLITAIPPSTPSVLLQAWPSLIPNVVLSDTTSGYDSEIWAEALAVWKGDSRLGALANQNEEFFFWQEIRSSTAFKTSANEPGLEWCYANGRRSNWLHSTVIRN